MPQITDEARSTVYLDGRLAGQELDQLTKKAKKYGESLSEAKLSGDTAGAKKIKAELAGVNKQIKTLDKDAAIVHKTLNNLNGASLNDLEKSFFKLRGHTKKLNQDTDEYKKSIADMKRIEAQMNKVKGEMKGTTTASGGLVNSLKGMLPALGPAAIVAGIVAITTKLFGMAKALDETRTKVAKLTGAEGDELDGLTAKVQSIATTFDTDFNESLVAANNFAKQMGISTEEALDKMQIGFANGADESGEFLAMLREYGPLLREAGYTADEAISMMTQQVKDGVFSDKGIDAVKEASLAIREMTPATAAAIDGIGLSSKEIQKGLAEGTIKVTDVIGQVSEKLGELPPQSSAVGTAIADIFKGAGEDAGLEYLKTLKDIDGNLDNLVESSGDFAKKQLELVKVNEQIEASKNRVFGTEGSWFGSLKLSWSKLVLAFMGGLEQFKASFGGLKQQFAAIKESLLPVKEALAPIIGYFKELLQRMGLFKKESDGMSKGTNIIGTALKKLLLPIRLLANGIQYIIGAWSDLFKIGKQTLEWIKSGFNSEFKPKFNFEGIKKSLDSFKTTIVDTFTNAEKESTDIAKEEAEKRKQAQADELKKKKQQLADYNAYQQQQAIEQAAAYSKVEADGLKRIQALQAEYDKKQLSAHDQKLQAIKDRYQKELDAAKGHNDLIVQLRQLMNQEIAAFEDEWAATEAEKKQAQIDKFESERARLIKEYRTLSLDELEQEEINSIRQVFETGRTLYVENIPMLTELKEQERQALKDIDDKYDDLRAAKELATLQEKHATMQAAISSFSSVVIGMKDVEVNAIDVRLQRELKQAGDNEEKKVELKEQAEEDKKKIQKKYADIEFAIQIGMILGNTAMAVAKVWGQTGIAGAIAQIAPIAMGAIQVAQAIQQRQLVKQLAVGKYNVIGEDDGRSYHADFSNRLSTGLVRTPTLVAEEPEIVVDTNTTRNIMQFRPDIFSDIMAMRVPQRADGKYTEATEGANSANAESIKKLDASVNTLNTLLSMMLEDGIAADISYDKITDAQERMQQVEKDTIATGS